MKAKKKFFKECHVAGRRYHDANEVWDELNVGTRISLVKDGENRYDLEAVALVYTDNEGEDYVIGYIPRSENTEISAFLEMGWGEVFECRISQKKPDATPEQQLYVTIRINCNN